MEISLSLADSSFPKRPIRSEANKNPDLVYPNGAYATYKFTDARFFATNDDCINRANPILFDFDNYYMGGPPWEQVKRYIEKSPHFRMQDNTTPTLIQFGTEDRSVDTGQGWEAYRAMQMIGKAPVRFILYPDEEHVFDKPVHQERKMREELAWFDRYLFGVTPHDNPAIKAGSPLERALALRGAARQEGRLGMLSGGKLVPEVAAWDDAALDVGRFEVTRAQWAAFDAAESF